MAASSRYMYSPPHHTQGVFVVWDPITGDLWTLLLPSCRSWTAAFVCAAAGCDHLDYAAGGPFRVIFVGIQWLSPSLTSVCVYSSETGAWSDDLTTVQHRKPIGSGRTAMVGNALYFWFRDRSGILKHDLDTQMSWVEQTPASIEGERVLLRAAEDGSLGFAMIQQSKKLSLWSKGADGWAQKRVIELSNLLPASAFSYPPQLVAFADGIGVPVLVQTVDGLFAIDLKSSHVREIGKSLKLHSYGVVPFVSFCTPGEILLTSMAPVRSMPELVDDLAEEILQRFPPGDPANLVRAALVCKGWRRLVSGLRFRHRFREFHGTAPVLGFFRRRLEPFAFDPTTSFGPPLFAGWRSGTSCETVDARHCRVLIHRCSSPVFTQGVFLVWDPITGDLQTLPRPQLLPSCRNWAAAILCSDAVSGDCDHLDCAGGHFRVVFVGTVWRLLPFSSVWVYSSEIGVWSKLKSVQHWHPINSGPNSVLMENALYFWFQDRSGILKHDLDTKKSSVVQTPASIEGQHVLLTATEDGRLGFAMIQRSYKLSLWSRSRGAGWSQDRVIELSALLPASALFYLPQLVAFADGIGDTIILKTFDGVFTIDLKSNHVRDIRKRLNIDCAAVPFMSFCNPAPGAAAASSGVGPNGSASTTSQT